MAYNFYNSRLGSLFRPRPSKGAMVFDANYYNPNQVKTKAGPYTNNYGPYAASGAAAGNTVSDYLSGRTPSKNSVMVSNNSFTFPGRGGQVIPQSSVYAAPANGQQPGQPGAPGSNPGSSSGGSGGGAAPQFQQYFQGRLYTDPQSYHDAYNAAVESNYQQQLTRLKGGYDQSIGNFENQLNQLKTGYDQGLGMLAQNKGALGRQGEDLATTYANSLEGLAKGRDSALTSQSGYFSNISPYAYQSQQQDYADRTNQEYTKGEESLNKQKSRNQQLLDEAYANLALQQKNYENSYQQNLTQAQQQRQNYEQNYQDTLAQLSQNKSGQFDVSGNQLLDWRQQMSNPTSVSAGTQGYDVAGFLSSLLGNVLTPGQQQQQPSFAGGGGGGGGDGMSDLERYLLGLG